MQYVRKGDVFNQDMSVKTMVYQASILFSSLYLYIYISNIRDIYICIIYIYIYHSLSFIVFFFRFCFAKLLLQKCVLSSYVLQVHTCIGVTYLYILVHCPLYQICSFKLFSSIKQDAPKVVLSLEAGSLFLCKNKRQGWGLFLFSRVTNLQCVQGQSLSSKRVHLIR